MSTYIALWDAGHLLSGGPLFPKFQSETSPCVGETKESLQFKISKLVIRNRVREYSIFFTFIFLFIVFHHRLIFFIKLFNFTFCYLHSLFYISLIIFHFLFAIFLFSFFIYHFYFLFYVFNFFHLSETQITWLEKRRNIF